MSSLKKLCLLTTFCFLCISSFSQDSNEFGKLSIEDLAITHSSIDSTADAEVLFEKEIVYFSYDERMGFVIYTELHRRVKIFKNSALDKGSITIPLFQRNNTDRQSLRDFKAITYNLENGRMTKSEFDEKSIFSEQISDYYYQKKANCPNVKEGSVIEYSYTMESPMNVVNKPRTWTFQNDVPTRLSEIEITIPSHFYYQIIMGGYLPLYKNEQKDVVVSMGHSRFDARGIKYNLAVKDAPSFKNEPFISTSKDYISKIEFELSSIQLPGQMVRNYNSTWESLDQTLLSSTSWGTLFKSNKDIKEIARQFEGIKDPTERMKKIHSYVTTNFKWDGSYSVWAGDKIKQLFESKLGNSTELNILLCTLLREADLDANPVIISTRENGRINEVYPLLDRFNNTIVSVQIGDELIFMDGTNPATEPGVLPLSCIVDQGRVILRDGGYFTNITSYDAYSELTKVNTSIDPESGSVKGTFHSSGAGIKALSLRTSYESKGEEEFSKDFIANQEAWELENVKVANLANKENSVICEAEFSMEDGGIMPDMIYINAVLADRVEENPFKKSSREFPVDFGYKINSTYMGEIDIPEGFEVESQPAPVSIAIPGGAAKFSFFVKKDGNKLYVVSRKVLSQKMYTAAEYPYLKELYAKIVEKHAEQIVLRKKI